jgi:hypothetical protein
MRDKVLKGADIFISANSLAPVLPLAVGAAGHERVRNTPHQAAFEKGLELATEASTIFNSPEMNEAFRKAFEH